MYLDWDSKSERQALALLFQTTGAGGRFIVMSRTKVVVIDDDPRVLESLQSLFDAAEIDALFYESAEEFLRKQDLDELACLVCDVMMPGLSGYELYLRLAEAQVLVPTMFITAHPETRGAERVRSFENVSVLEKPFEGEELLNWVLQVIESRS